jgi:hypothetical protein
VDQPRRAARRAAREIILLDERGAQSTPRRIARDAGAGDAAADDEEVEGRGAEGVQPRLTCRYGRRGGEQSVLCSKL